MKPITAAPNPITRNFSTSGRSLFPISLDKHKPIKIFLIISAVIYFIEFLICNLFFAQISTPFFIAPIPSPSIEGFDFLYAHSITRQYGFFAVQFSLSALLFATNPGLFQNFIRGFALVQMLMAALGGFALITSSISLFQFLPSFIWQAGSGILMLAFCPNDKAHYSGEEARAMMDKQWLFFGITISARFQLIALRVLCAVAGSLWILWSLGSTVFWEIGVANISSDRVAEMNLVTAMRLNEIVRCQQGVMLFGIGLLTLLTAQYPVQHRQMLRFIMAQQIINAASAAVELGFGTIFLPQFVLVASVQAITFILFLLLYPKVQSPKDSETGDLNLPIQG